MGWLLWVLLAASGQAPAAQGPLDVSSLTFGKPAIITEIDTGKIQGDPRRLAWAPDGTRLYLQVVEGKAEAEKPHHFFVALEGGALTSVETQPSWAFDYWSVKQDRTAPGMPSLVIAVEQAVEESRKQGMGPSGALNREAGSAAAAVSDPKSLSDGTAPSSQVAHIVRLMVLGQEIAAFVNEPKPVPGMKFSWGPERSGALVFVGQKGELIFFDQKKHKRQVPGVKDALLPAWSTDGQRLAYVQKTGRDTYALAWLTVTR